MKWLHVVPGLALVTLAGLAACERTESPEPFPQAAADGWLGSFNGGDVDGLMLIYSQDARVLPPEEPPISGHDAIQAFWRDYKPGQVRIALGEVESRRTGDFWFREGGYTAMFPDEGEPRVGKFIELWKKEGNNWLLYRQMWNRNAPLAAQTAPSATADDAT